VRRQPRPVVFASLAGEGPEARRVQADTRRLDQLLELRRVRVLEDEVVGQPERRVCLRLEVERDPGAGSNAIDLLGPGRQALLGRGNQLLHARGFHPLADQVADAVPVEAPGICEQLVQRRPGGFDAIYAHASLPVSNGR